MIIIAKPARMRTTCLDGVEDGRFVAFGTGHDFALGGFHGDGAFALAVHVQQLAQIETRPLQNL